MDANFVSIKLLGELPSMSRSGKQVDSFFQIQDLRTCPSPQLLLFMGKEPQEFYLVLVVQTPHLWSFWKLRTLSGLFTLSELHLSPRGKSLRHLHSKISLIIFRPDTRHTFGGTAHPLAPGIKCLGKGCFCHQVVRNSLWNEKRQYSQRAAWGWGRENGNRDA